MFFYLLHIILLTIVFSIDTVKIMIRPVFLKPLCTVFSDPPFCALHGLLFGAYLVPHPFPLRGDVVFLTDFFNKKALKFMLQAASSL